MADTLVGVFDSGVGGLSVLRAIRAELPDLPIMYFADQARVPYGQRSLEDVRRFADQITRFLIRQGATAVVVACNTASAAALRALRSTYPGTPFVGMEPAVKPAGEYSASRVVGVLATPATFQSELYASVLERFAGDVKVLENTCPGLVQEIEAGRAAGGPAERILRGALEPMLDQGIDTVVLGCTHYPFAMELIQNIVGPNVKVIDPAPAVARQVARVVAGSSLAPSGRPRWEMRYFTSGDARNLGELLPLFSAGNGPVEHVHLDDMGENFRQDQE